jgi:formylmethanofuran dehydrogenase subunit C
MSTRLRLRTAPPLRVDLRGVTPTAQIERLMVTHGNQTLALAELFDITQLDGPADELVLEGDLSRFDRIGWQMASGSIVVEGDAGDYAGACVSGGAITVRGNAGDLAACEMAGGTLTIEGHVGDFAASTLPGSMDGMRGGTLIVKGNAGERFADRMRRGSALVFGNVGDFVASRMVAGTVAIGGTAGAHVGYGMRRGSVVLAGAAPTIAPTFVPALVDAAVFWQLLARDLARHGGPFATLPARRISRHLGDLGAGGKGELIVVDREF